MRNHVISPPKIPAESTTLGLLGGFVGAAIGILAIVGASAAKDWTTTLNPLITLPAPLIGAITGLLAGTQPAQTLRA